MKIELKPDIYWVGSIDWKLRNFHGFLTPRGGTYNSYLIVDEKVTLIDTTKYIFEEELIRRVENIISLDKIDYIIMNHSESDHSQALKRMVELCPNAEIVTSKVGAQTLEKHYHQNWEYKIVNTGDVLNIGKRNLTFTTLPMVHWPDSMVTYCIEDKILFSNDAFGQQYATFERFADEVKSDILMEELKRYYTNIVMPYAIPVKSALANLGGLDVDIIAPSHGLMLRTPEAINSVLSAYTHWSNNHTDGSAIIIYDSMWESTRKMAEAIQIACEQTNTRFRVYNLAYDDISTSTSDLMTASFLFVGSPTLNAGIMPSVAGFLHYMQGLKPKNKTSMAFGSYGWSDATAKTIEPFLKTVSTEIKPAISFNYIPTKQQLEEMTLQVAQILLEKK